MFQESLCCLGMVVFGVDDCRVRVFWAGGRVGWRFWFRGEGKVEVLVPAACRHALVGEGGLLLFVVVLV